MFFLNQWEAAGCWLLYPHGRRKTTMTDHVNHHHQPERQALLPGELPPFALKGVNWKRLLGYLKPYRGRMTLALGALLLGSAFGLAFPLVIVRLLDSVTRMHNLGSLSLLAGLLLAVFLGQAAFNFVQSYLLAYIGEHIVYDLRTSLYAQLQRLSLDFYSAHRVGDLVSRLGNDVTQMRTLLTSNLTTILSQVLTLIGSVVILFTLNTRFTLFILALVPVLILVAFVFGARIRKNSARIQDQLADSTVVAEEGLQGIRIVKSFGREQYETERYNKAMHKTFRAALKMAVYSSLFASVVMFLGFTAIGAIMWYGGAEVIAGRLTLSMITGFLIYGVSIAASLGGLGSMYGQINASVGGVKHIFEILDKEPAVKDLPGAKPLTDCRGRLTFQDVSFGYNKDVTVIKKLSLTIREGEILALVGPSGAGKSTVFNLIPRFYDTYNGIIRIDGHDIRTLTQESLRAQMAIVPQETMLFGGSIRENILYGKLDATEEEIVAAARAANAHEFIMQFPDKYETRVGERGINLSGGQRQRLAIARALLKNPRLLLLDEATSSLDSESEELVHEALNRLMQNRTTIIIAHRLSTIKAAHRIAVLDCGQIVELGTHEELMQLNGMYARLYTMQFRNSGKEQVALPGYVDGADKEEDKEEETEVRGKETINSVPRPGELRTSIFP
jgi:subfamily B ATP-binding cassette protein MsbA